MKTKCLILSLICASALQAAPPPGYTLVFQSNFANNQLNTCGTLGVPFVTAWGLLPNYQLGNSWQAQFLADTPNGKPVGDVYFTQPKDPSGFPCPVWNGWGQLIATPYKDSNGHWRSFAMSTVDTRGEGFTQALGYWECSFTIQGTPGIWPSFWLKGLEDIPYLAPQTKNVSELDVCELYGHNLVSVQQTVHDWTPQGIDQANRINFAGGGEGQPPTWSGTTTQSFQSGSHTYGCLITASTITFYYDGVATWVTSTPASATEPLYAILDYALGAGYPDPTTVYPIWVQYIRCYAPPK